MQVSVESPTKLERRMTVTVPFTQLDAAFDKHIAKIAKTAKLKGFRPGNVPLAQVKKLYGDAARQEALSEVIQNSLYAALEQEKLRPVAPPQIQPKAMEPSQPLEYVAIFEVLPEIGSVQFAASSLEKAISSIEESDIDKVITRLGEQHTTWTKVDRAAQDKDQVVVDFRGSLDGKTFQGGEAHDYPVVIGSQTMIPGFEEGVIGMKAGEKRTITVTFPADYFSKDVAGKDTQFDLHAHKVSEPHAPAMDEALVKKFGIASGQLKDLRAEIRKNLEREVERIMTTKLKAKVFDLLIEQNPMDIPASMIKHEAERIHKEMHPHHGHDHHHTADEMQEFDDAAKRNVILGILIGEFVKQHQLKADSQRVQGHITKMAAAYENPAEVMKWYASDRSRLAEVEMLILEEQVVEKLLENVKIIEKTLSYTDLIKS